MSASSGAGVYTFTITGQSATLMRGIGMLNASTNRFTGDIMCDPATVSGICGTYGRFWCGSDASCAFYYIMNYNTHNGYNTPAVIVTALPISNITTIR